MIQDLIDDLGLSEGDTRRINCPHCSGFKTFTISILDGVAVWNCYKASCPSKGAAKQTLSKDAIVNRVVPLVKINRSNVYKIPDSFSSFFPDKMVRYMDKNNVTKSWRKNDVELFHDVLQDRAVFAIKKDGIIIDAIGRALKYGTKWHRYGDTNEPFLAGTGDDLYLVEDAASACAVSSYGVGMALLGTNLTDRALEIAKQYPRCIVCLDKDASKKALTLTVRLKQFTSTTMRLLEFDPKEYPEGVLA